MTKRCSLFTRLFYYIGTLVLFIFPLWCFGQKDTVKLGNNRQILVFPVAAKSIETGWSLGAAGSITFHLSKTDTVTRTSNLQSIVLYSFKKQFIAAVNGAEYFKNEKYILNEQLSFSSFPDKFWGLGKYSPDSAVEPYTFKQYYIYLHLLRNLGNNLYIGGLYELQNVFEVDYMHGGLFDQQNIVGRNGYFISGMGLSFTYDDRNNAFAPDKGSFAQIYFNHFDKCFGSDYVYTNVVIDLRKFIRIYKQQVLALQAYSFSNLGDNVPLRSLATLGGSGSMRGYYDGRFRDKQQLVLQAEYRMPLYKKFGAAVFANTGDVGHTITDFSIPDLKFSFGGGLRYAINKSEKLNLRLDYGVGLNGNSGLYFQLGEAF
jgi:outer membrane protein assembly factor BamA